MKKQILLHIPEPCHENWDAMTPQDKGRHCQSCNKVVVDFSVMTDRQVLDYFKNAQGNTCGRFHNDQLQRPLIEPQKQLGKWNYFLASVASFFVGLKLMAQPKILLGKVANPKQEIVNKTTQNNAIKGEVVMPELITVTGKVTDEKGAALVGVSVTIGKTNKGVVTRSDGGFRIKCPKDAELIFRVIGYEKRVIKTTQLNRQNAVVKLINTVNDDMYMGGLAVITYEKSATPLYDVKGFVFDENFKAIKDAVITVVGMNKKTTSNYLGSFEIENIKKSILKTLQIKADEYETESINITDELLNNIDDLQITLKKKNNDALNADVKVTGKVVDEKGAAITDASIQIKGTKLGTTSKADGSFELNKLGSNTKLSIVVSSLGYETKTIEVENKDFKNELSVVLKVKSENLDEIILNTGIGLSCVKRCYTGGAVIISNNNSKNKSCVIEKIVKPIQKILDIEPIKIYPNPVAKNANVHIAIKQTGTWELQLFTVQSNLLSVKEVVINTQNQIIDYTLPNNIVSGNYFLRLVNKETKKVITEKIIVL